MSMLLQQLDFVEYMQTHSMDAMSQYQQQAKPFWPITKWDMRSESVCDLWPPVYGPFKAIYARLIVQDGLFDLFLGGHHKWT